MRGRHGPPVRTVRASRALARLRAPCGAASAHQACNLAPGGGPGTVRGGRRTGGTVRGRHGPPVRTVRPLRAGARFRVPCGFVSAHQACNLAPGGGPGTVRGGRRTGGAVRARHGPPVRTVRTSRARAGLRAPCGAASAHQARNLAPGGGPGTVRGRRWTGGTVRARHGPPVRTVRASRARAALRTPCGFVSAHQACNLAPGGGPGTVPARARSRQPAGVAVAVAVADGCSAARTASTTGCAPPGSVNSVDCVVIQYGSAKASARPMPSFSAK
ncbi:hypothetical protein EDF23_101182 [Curtobacterium sp. PhB128]|nr:hypothetical protein EDF23_101182 [Curtobacterium sp. PhB128]TCL98866.1 hypothetical protein EDF29_101182 [Curtobacterium sp. PhB138]